MSDTHDTTLQADAPPVMVAVGADLIREATSCIARGVELAQTTLNDLDEQWDRYSPRGVIRADAVKADIARMEATAKALTEALPGGAA